MEIRFAEEGELEQVNLLRKQVHGLHAAGRPETFKPGFDRIELNMWEFNRDALAFYEAAGFVTYRRYLELKL